MPSTLPRKPLVVPQFGVIRGGRLDGWYFHFLHFAATPEGLEIRVRCTPPAWPFPCDLVLHPSMFLRLIAVRGSRAKRLDADRLIASAYSLEGQTPPEWMFATRMTLRAAVKRSATWPWRNR